MSQQLKVRTRKHVDYINPKIIISYGAEFASIVQKAYASESASEKLTNAFDIYKCNSIKDEVKIKFIGDVMSKPKSRRLAIAKQLQELLVETIEKKMEEKCSV